MTSLEPRNPETDELLSPENSMFLLIDYQPTQVNSINSMNKQDLIRNVTNLTELMKKYGCTILEYQDVKGIDPERMKERFEMDADERYGNLKAKIFQRLYPILKHLPADKKIFVFQFESERND